MTCSSSRTCAWSWWTSRVLRQEVSYESIPYKSVERFSVETAGTFDLHAELKIWSVAAEPIAKEFDKSANIYEVQAILTAFAMR